MNYLSQYVSFLGKFISVKHSLRVVFDSSNGSTSPVLQRLFSTSFQPHFNLITTHFINSAVDGNFPSHGPDPWKGNAIPALGKEVVRRKADCGAIFDADGDRVFFMDDKGRFVPPDHTAILMAQNFRGPVILDVRQGFLVREWLTARKRKIVDSRVGHFFIKKLMRQKKIPFAAELSGHYYFKDFFYCDSGIFAAIQFMNAISNLKSQILNFSDWVDAQPKYYQSGEINFVLPVIPANAGIQKSPRDVDSRLHGNDKRKDAILKKLEQYYQKRVRNISKLDGIKMEFGKGDGAWWFSVRPSNTEDLLRLNLEAKEKRVFEEEMRAIDKLIKSMQ